jgi:molybdate/tungstate transport system substrate-binding protein
MPLADQMLTRRDLVACASRLALAAAIARISTGSLATELTVLDVAYAGSMASLMEGPLKAAVAQNLRLDMHGRAQGSSALAQLIVGGSIRPDVFIAVTPGPMVTVLRAGKAATAEPIAHTEMVIAYSPKSRFRPQFEEAARGDGHWWEILQSPGLRFGRTDPITDPQGRNIIFTMMLASKIYKQPDLAEKILGPAINQKQIFTEPTVQARLESGSLDASSAYKTQPGPFNLPYLTLPKELNLSAGNVHEQYPDVALTVGGKTYTPEPLIYYAAVLANAPNRVGALKFTQWLKSELAQRLFRTHNYDSPGEASALYP